MTTTLELVQYYANLLILQYAGKPKAYATIQIQATPVVMPQVSIQVLTFTPAPSSGTFIVSYKGVLTSPLNWNDSTATIQAAIRGLPDLDSIVVTGTIAGGTLTVTFNGVTPVPELLVIVANTLDAEVTVAETDVTLPLAVQDGFNLTGSNIAVGAQLDILGKYVGVSRTGLGFSATITLDDTDFLNLIIMAIIKNSSGSSLATITGLIYQFFGTNITVVDYTDMLMSYAISSDIGSTDFLQLVITEGLLPKPMAVGEFITIFDATDAFGFDGTMNSGGFGDTGDPSVGGILATLYLP